MMSIGPPNGFVALACDIRCCFAWENVQEVEDVVVLCRDKINREKIRRNRTYRQYWLKKKKLSERRSGQGLEKKSPHGFKANICVSLTSDERLVRERK